MHSLLLAPFRSSTISINSSKRRGYFGGKGYFGKPEEDAQLELRIGLHEMLAPAGTNNDQASSSSTSGGGAGGGTADAYPSSQSTRSVNSGGGEKSSSGGSLEQYAISSRSSSNSSLVPAMAECACAVVETQDWQRAMDLMEYICGHGGASEEGEAMERAMAQFAQGIGARMAGAAPAAMVRQVEALLTRGGMATPAGRSSNAGGEEEWQAAYLAFNQVSPFVRFCHLTANQAILEAVDGNQQQQVLVLHIVDMEVMQGVQWPPLLQALAERPGGPPARVRISGAGPDARSLQLTAQRLSLFAASLALPFHFEFAPIHATSLDDLSAAILASCNPQNIAASDLPRNSTVIAFNCIPLGLPRRSVALRHCPALLRLLRSLAPAVVAIADAEAGLHLPSFRRRFLHSSRHYSSLFDSLDATLPPTSIDRSTVEQVWLRREIMDLLSNHSDRDSHGGPSPLEREHTPRWRDIMAECGFRAVPHSAFALSQARLLLRLHYPSEGYHLIEESDHCSLALGWQHHPLFAVSCWH